MKRSILSIALLACVPTGAALAHASTSGDHGVTVRQDEEGELRGQIQSIDAKQNRFVLANGEKQATVQFNESTAWMLDGEKASRSQVLKVGQNVVVTHSEGVATMVEAQTEQ